MRAYGVRASVGGDNSEGLPNSLAARHEFISLCESKQVAALDVSPDGRTEGSICEPLTASFFWDLLCGWRELQ
jgi:hypothetical protein